MKSDGEDGAVKRDGSQWVSLKALTPGGFDAIFPRRESTWEELVNNICPISGRLTPVPNSPAPQQPRPLTHHSAVNPRTSNRLWTGPSIFKDTSQKKKNSPLQSQSITGILTRSEAFIHYTQTTPISDLHIRGVARSQTAIKSKVWGWKACSAYRVAQPVGAGELVMSQTSSCQADLCNEFFHSSHWRKRGHLAHTSCAFTTFFSPCVLAQDVQLAGHVLT